MMVNGKPGGARAALSV